MTTPTLSSGLSSVSKLRVSLKWDSQVTLEVGTLAKNAVGRIAFEYSPSWLESQPHSLSPFKLDNRGGVQLAQTERTPFNGLFGAFSDSLPDGWGLLLMERGLRRLGVAFEETTALDHLAWVGQRAMGALCYEPCYEFTDQSKIRVDLERLNTESQKILTGRTSAVLTQLIALGGSPGGARPKVMVGVQTKRLKGDTYQGDLVSGNESLLPSGFEHWLLKFRSPSDHPEDTLIEYLYSLTARKVGLEVEPTALFQGKNGHIWFGMRRFDRASGGARVHMHSLAGLLHANFRLPSLDYQSLLKVTQVLTKSMKETEQAFRLAIFNAEFHNRDDHAKNFSFLMNRQGEWHLSPSYDLTWSAGMGGEHATSYCGEGKSPGLSQYLKLAASVGLPEKRAREVITEVQSGRSSLLKSAREFGVKSLLKKMGGKSLA